MRRLHGVAELPAVVVVGAPAVPLVAVVVVGTVQRATGALEVDPVRAGAGCRMAA